MSDPDPFLPPEISAPALELSLDGTSIVFCEAGPTEGAEQGEAPPAVLIHGWSCNRHSLAPQFDFFRRSRRTVAFDLRGHGDSSVARGPYSVAQFAADLRTLCRELGLERPVLVGHSMGGAISLEACRTHSDLASAVVLLDGYGCYPDPERNALGEMLLEQIGSLGFSPVMEMVVDQVFFLSGADERLVSWVKQQLVRTDAEMAVEAYRDLLRWDGAAAASACTVPVLNLVSTTPFNQPHRFAELCSTVVSGQTVGAGHFHGLEVPDQVHLMVSAFLARCA